MSICTNECAPLVHANDHGSSILVLVRCQTNLSLSKLFSFSNDGFSVTFVWAIIDYHRPQMDHSSIHEDPTSGIDITFNHSKKQPKLALLNANFPRWLTNHLSYRQKSESTDSPSRTSYSRETNLRIPNIAPPLVYWIDFLFFTLNQANSMESSIRQSANMDIGFIHICYLVRFETHLKWKRNQKGLPLGNAEAKWKI